MNNSNINQELNSFLPDNVPNDEELAIKTPWKIGLLLFVLLALLSYFTCDYAIETRKQEILTEVQKRLDVSATGKAKVIETWLAATAQRADRIADNDLFQLFATEVNLASDGKLPKPLADQLPYMQNAFTTFANQDNLLGAYLIGKDGRAYLSSGDAPALNDFQRNQARTQYNGETITFLPMRATEVGLVFDFMVPIKAAQSGVAKDKPDIVGVLLITVPASKQLAEFLTPAPFSDQRNVPRLFQIRDGRFYELYPSKPPYIANGAAPFSPDSLGFQTVLPTNEPLFYISGAAIAGTNLVIFQQIRSADALVGLGTYSLFISGLAISFIVIIFSVLIAIWLTLKGQNARALATQYKDLAAQINVQRRLLGSINNTIDELISLTDPEGSYIYANPSLARFADTPLRSIPGKTDRDLFGEKAARELAEYDHKAIATEQTVNAFVEIETLSGTRTLRTAKSRFLNDDGVFIGIVTVSSDITEYVEFQRRKEEMSQKANNVLARMVEANDPYLFGHSGQMGELANRVAAHMGLSEEMKRVIKTSAQLSQIGKISIPRNIRVKESRLTEDEQKIMQKHVYVAEKILVEAGLEKAIIDAITQINEHLDGSGYPNGLNDSEIDMPARILGMADILIARISPRSYRKAITIDEAIRVFRNNPEKYDQKIVEALVSVFGTEAGAAFKERLSETGTT